MHTRVLKPNGQGCHNFIKCSFLFLIVDYGRATHRVQGEEAGVPEAKGTSAAAGMVPQSLPLLKGTAPLGQLESNSPIS